MNETELRNILTKVLQLHGITIHAFEKYAGLRTIVRNFLKGKKIYFDHGQRILQLCNEIHTGKVEVKKQKPGRPKNVSVD